MFAVVPAIDSGTKPTRTSNMTSRQNETKQEGGNANGDICMQPSADSYFSYSRYPREGVLDG